MGPAISQFKLGLSKNTLADMQIHSCTASTAPLGRLEATNIVACNCCVSHSISTPTSSSSLIGIVLDIDVAIGTVVGIDVAIGTVVGIAAGIGVAVGRVGGIDVGALIGSARGGRLDTGFWPESCLLAATGCVTEIVSLEIASSD